jgi:subtilisin family serine protease
MLPTDLVGLRPLMERTEGRREVSVAVIDGPSWLDHPALSGQHISEVDGSKHASCGNLSSAACAHGTFVIGSLAAKRAYNASSICPGCSFLLRSIFSEDTIEQGHTPVSTPDELGRAIIDSVSAGANVINLSVAIGESSSPEDVLLREALDYAARSGVLVVAAAGNQATVGATVITRHPWVIPVASCGLSGRPTYESNLGRSIGSRGLSAPGENVPGFEMRGAAAVFRGTSAAAPFVTGTIALLWSEFPSASAVDIKLAVTGPSGRSRRSITPPLLDAQAAYLAMALN